MNIIIKIKYAVWLPHWCWFFRFAGSWGIDTIPQEPVLWSASIAKGSNNNWMAAMWQDMGVGHIHVGVYGQVIEEESDYVGISQSIIICDRYHHIPNDDDLITGIITLLQEHCTSVTPLSLMLTVMKHTFHSSTTSFSRWHHVSTLYNGVSNVLWMPCGHRIWKIWDGEDNSLKGCFFDFW